MKSNIYSFALGAIAMMFFSNVCTSSEGQWQEKRFKSGTIRHKVLLSKHGKYLESQYFYENGQIKFSYKILKESNDFSPEVYKFESYTDIGQEISKGECTFAATDNFYGEDCVRFTGIRNLYNKNDQKTGYEHYELGKLNGEMLQVDLETKTEALSIYSKGIMLKRTTRELETKKIIKQEEFFEDGSRKKEKK